MTTRRPVFPFDGYFDHDAPARTVAQRWQTLIDLGYDGGHLLVDRGDPDAWDRAHAIARLRHDTGLPVLSAYTAVNLSRPQPPGARSVVDTLDLLEPGDTLELALLVGWRVDQSDPTHDALAIDWLGRLLDQARPRGVRLALYPHTNFWLERIDDALRIADALDDPALGITVSGLHWYALNDGDLDHQLARVGRRLFRAHVSGSRPRPPGQQAGLPVTVEPVGQGDFPLRAFHDALDRVGYAGPIGFVGHDMDGHPDDHLRQSLAAWRAVEAQAAPDRPTASPAR
jgi:sugar phosphate isomerase/epimerase